MEKKLGKITLEGASGTSYRFNVYPWEADLGALGAVYVVTRRKERARGGHSHRRIFSGQTGDLSTSVAGHRQSATFGEKNANCVCVLKETTETERLRISSDLISKFRPPCNEVAAVV